MSSKTLSDESLFRMLTRMFSKRGISVRRENLSRGSAFRVRSGNCSFNGSDLIFVDKRLPIAQQVSFLLDCLVEAKLTLDTSEQSVLPAATRALLAEAATAGDVEPAAVNV